VDRHWPLQRPRHRGHLRLVAVGADADRHPPAEVDALQPLQEAVHEVLPRLLAVRDDIDAGGLLVLQGDEHRIALGGDEVGGRHAPGRPELLGLRQPGRLWQAPRDRGEQRAVAPVRPTHA
jgi:hypothetical protein